MKIKQIIPGGGWHAIVPDENDEVSSVPIPIACFALVEEEGEDGVLSDEVVPLCPDEPGGLPNRLTIPSGLLGLAAPGTEKERYWDDVAKQERELKIKKEREKEHTNSLKRALTWAAREAGGGSLTLRGEALGLLAEAFQRGHVGAESIDSVAIDDRWRSLAVLQREGLLTFESRSYGWVPTRLGRDVAKAVSK